MCNLHPGEPVRVHIRPQPHLGTHQQRETVPGQIPEQCNKGKEIPALLKCPKPGPPCPPAQQVKDYTDPRTRGFVLIYILRSCSKRTSGISQNAAQRETFPSPEHVPLQRQLRTLKMRCPGRGRKAPCNWCYSWIALRDHSADLKGLCWQLKWQTSTALECGMTTEDDFTLRFVPALWTYTNTSLATCTPVHVIPALTLHAWSSAFAEAIFKHFFFFFSSTGWSYLSVLSFLFFFFFIIIYIIFVDH